MIRWLRVVLPSVSSLVLVVLLYCGVLALAQFLEWRFGKRVADEMRVPWCRAILVFSIVSYALGRGFSFHPLFRPAYQSWLAATPWTSQKPLPLGPIHLVLQDVVLIGSAVLLVWLTGDFWAFLIPQLFLTVYLAIIAISLFGTGAWPWGYAVAFGLGVVVWQWPDPATAASAAHATYAVAFVGLRKALARFPWEIDWQAVATKAGVQINPQQGAAEVLGWPFGRLAPTGPGLRAPIPAHHALLISMLLGWYTFVVASHFPPAVALILMVAGLIVPMVRIGVYCDGYLPPISLFGRLTTGRLIIPAYDQIFVAPLLAIAVSSSLTTANLMLGLPLLVVFPVGVAVVLFISLAVGPSLLRWRLTGNHRIVEGTQRTNAVKVG